MGNNVTIRYKKLVGNRSSVYLDFSSKVLLPGGTKETRRKFLNLYVYDHPKNTEEREHNKKTLQEATIWRAKFLNIISETVFFSELERETYEKKQKEKNSFSDFYDDLMNKRSKKTREQWVTTKNYLKAFYDADIKFGDLTVQFVEEFKSYLFSLTMKGTKRIHQNSAKAYFKIFRTALNAAYKFEHISRDLCRVVSDIKMIETTREFLIEDEVKQLMKTPCKNELLKRASIFAIYSGLRLSDISKLQWNQILFQKDGAILNVKQQKTKGLIELPLNPESIKYLGEKKSDDTLVFEGFSKIKKTYNKILANWVEDAGIKKKITFHCLRHTNATLLLNKGADLYTVSKLLGHNDIVITQIYAKILDESKRKAVNLLKFEE
jgi:integrase